MASHEFTNLYSEEPSNENYINSLYSNILNRSPDSEDFKYWLTLLNLGIEDQSKLLMRFSESQENKIIFSHETSIY